MGDKCYCVFDSDPESNPNINEAFDLVNGYKHKGLECIFSNPSLRFGLYYIIGKLPMEKAQKMLKNCKGFGKGRRT